VIDIKIRVLSRDNAVTHPTRDMSNHQAKQPPRGAPRTTRSTGEKGFWGGQDEPKALLAKPAASLQSSRTQAKSTEQKEREADKHGQIDDARRSANRSAHAIPSALAPPASPIQFSPALSTRSKKVALFTPFEWETVTTQKVKHLKTEDIENSENMSRNRPRGASSRDNGLAANEEVDMWNRILLDLGKAKEKNDKQKVLGQQILALNEKILKGGNSKYIVIISSGSCSSS